MKQFAFHIAKILKNILPSAMSKIELFKLVMATSLGEGKLI